MIRHTISLSAPSMRLLKVFYLFFFIWCASAGQKDYYPLPLLMLDNFFSHHVILVEKSTHRLMLYKNEDGYPKLIKTYNIVTGKNKGDKFVIGDRRTPEGVFFLTEFISRKKLVQLYGKEGEIYGVGAFVTNYPNPYDRYLDKKGSGIWLHATNDEDRLEKKLDSRGCVVTANLDLIEISKYIELNKTVIVVTQDIHYINQELFEKKRKNITDTVYTWLNAWKNEDLNTYIDQYHARFSDPIKGKTKTAFRFYKSHVFKKPGKPHIEIDKLSILLGNEYAVANFYQKYTSATINDSGRKTLYLKQNDQYEWKIIRQNWTKRGLNKPTDGTSETLVTFHPSMRFFETNNAESILSIKSQ